MAKKFDIGDFARSVNQIVSKSDTTGETVIQYIDLDLLEENQDNFYGIRDLDTLVNSIEMDGLQQPIVVTRDGDKYKIISGHRRRAAIAQLVADGKEDFRRVPCIVRTYQSPAMAELQLILANSTARVLSPAETAKQAERVELLLYQLKEEGQEFPGRMRDQVAAACNVSAAKLGRLKVIRKGLQPVWMQLFESDRLPESTAYAIARMPGGLQERIYKVVGDGVNAGAMERILELSEKTSWTPKIYCPDGTACRRGDTFLKHDIENPYTPCLGETCCLNCPKSKYDWYACGRMCSKAIAARKEKKQEKDTKEQKRLRKESDKYKQQTMRNAQRIVKALDAAGISDKTMIQWNYYSLSAKEIREYAAGKFPDDVWSYGKLEPDRLASPAKIAKQLHCSTDYLLGVTDELTQYPVENPVETVDTEPEESQDESNDFYPQWRTGTPPVSCEVVACFDVGKVGLFKSLVYYDATLQRYSFKRNGEPINYECVKWLPLPKEENENA